MLCVTPAAQGRGCVSGWDPYLPLQLSLCLAGEVLCLQEDPRSRYLRSCSSPRAFEPEQICVSLHKMEFYKIYI